MSVELSQIEGGLDEFLLEYGALIGRRAQESLAPLHVPGEHDAVDVTMFRRKPYEPQAHVVSAACEALKRQKAVIIVGEMGTGKTLIGQCIAHAASRHRKGYRVLVFAPSHLVDKWKREILATIPRAHVYTFDRSVGKRGGKSGVDDSWKKVIRYYGQIRDMGPAERIIKGEEVVRDEGNWIKPQQPEFVIIGQGQSKFDPKWQGLGESKFGRYTKKWMVVGQNKVYDDRGRLKKNRQGEIVTEKIKARVACCPKCGEPVRDSNGVMVAAKEMTEEQMWCGTKYLQEVHDPELNPDRNTSEGFDRICPAGEHLRDLQVGKRHKARTGRVYEVRECREPLWTWTRQPYKWAPARFMHAKMKGAFDFFLLDEMHEEKSDESAQSMAAGKLMAISKKIVGLTGTLIGGYADHLLPLLFRMAPETLRAQGIGWKDNMPFAKKYGRIKTVITRKSNGDVVVRGGGKERNASSMRKKKDSTKKDETIAPGIMPNVFGDILIGNTIFLALGEMARELPALNGGGQGEPVPVDMGPELGSAYRDVADVLEETVKEMMIHGNMRLLGAMLHTLMDYPDHPYGWAPPPGCEGLKAVGYFDDGDGRPRNRDTYVGVVQPEALDRETIRPKEAKLVEMCLAEKKEGRQVWVYCQMTGDAKRNVQPRLKSLLEARGLRVGVLRADTVSPRDREAWIFKNGPKYDVVISHPRLVSTGLDFFDKAGSFNFATIIFYETGYDLNLFRQASRRAWRIGQVKECRVYYLYYRGTMQERAMTLMGKKLAAAQALEGKFSSEGLVAMAGEENAAMALAASLSAKVENADRAWAKIGEATRVVIGDLVKAGKVDRIRELAGMGAAEKAHAALVLKHLTATPEPVGASGLGGESLAKMYLAMKKMDIDLDDLF